jgi:hypothetical protein
MLLKKIIFKFIIWPYYELALHPANNIPYTPKDDNARVYNTPIEKSERVRPCPNGIIAHPNKLKIKVDTGAK